MNAVRRGRAARRTKAVHDGLAETAARDGLTGVFNRRELDTRAEQAVALAARHGRLDLDGHHLRESRVAEEQVAVARKAYALLGAQDSILHEICPGTHQWHEEHLAENLAFLFKHSKA